MLSILLKSRTFRPNFGLLFQGIIKTLPHFKNSRQKQKLVIMENYFRKLLKNQRKSKESTGNGFPSI